MHTGLSGIIYHNKRSTPVLAAYVYAKLQTRWQIHCCHSLTLYYTVTVVTLLTFLLWLCLGLAVPVLYRQL